jgi:hypothetical protein
MSAFATTTTTTTLSSAATTVQLRTEPRKLVHFSEEVVDNEHLNRKKSKGARVACVLCAMYMVW